MLGEYVVYLHKCSYVIRTQILTGIPIILRVSAVDRYISINHVCKASCKPQWTWLIIVTSSAWIGSIQVGLSVIVQRIILIVLRNDKYSLVFVPGLITGRLFDLGIFRLPIALASVTLVASTILTAQCTQYWHFLLCQGIAVGVCNSLSGHPLTYLIFVVELWYCFWTHNSSSFSLVQEETRARAGYPSLWVICGRNHLPHCFPKSRRTSWVRSLFYAIW